MRSLIAILFTVLLAGCSESDQDLPAIVVSPADRAITIRGRGELIASESIPISLPADVRMWFNIAWLIPEYSEVRRGDVVATFDDLQVRSNREYSILELAGTQQELSVFERTSGIDRTEIDHETARNLGEVDIAENFVEVDPKLFSQNEIIDALGDLDYLGVEGAFFEWQARTHDQRAETERDRIAAKRRASELKLEKQDAALAMMELRSPADGTFVYAVTPWGQKLSKGQQVSAGRPVGFLPKRGKVRARIFVPEADAVGLAAEQEATIRLDSAAGRTFRARVTSVSAVATPREREDPQKYFVVEADLNEVDPELMRVGSSITADIVTGTVSNAMMVPHQAVFFDEDRPFVYVLNGGETSERVVTLGLRGPNLVEITHGLSAGERISVVSPEQGAG